MVSSRGAKLMEAMIVGRMLEHPFTGNYGQIDGQRAMLRVRRGLGPAVGVGVACLGSYVLWLALVYAATWAADALF